MINFKILYSVAGIVFFILQGPFYYLWHGFEKPKLLISYLQQTLLNSLGSLIGWIAGYFLIFYRMANGFNNFNPGIADLVIFLIAFYGMTGLLPHMLIDKTRLGKS